LVLLSLDLRRFVHPHLNEEAVGSGDVTWCEGTGGARVRRDELFQDRVAPRVHLLATTVSDGTDAVVARVVGEFGKAEHFQ